jgi:hypothetical protein
MVRTTELPSIAPGDGEMTNAPIERRQFLCCLGCAGMAAIAGCTVNGTSERRDAPMSIDESAVRPEDFGYCGADCSVCDVYRATVHGDQEARLRAAEKWQKTAREHWGMETLDPAVLDCRGCRAEGAKHKGYGRCPMLACARRRGVASCGLCPEWRDCQYLEEVFANEPSARANLQKIADSTRH